MKWVIDLWCDDLLDNTAFHTSNTQQKQKCILQFLRLIEVLYTSKIVSNPSYSIIDMLAIETEYTHSRNIRNLPFINWSITQNCYYRKTSYENTKCFTCIICISIPIFIFPFFMFIFPFFMFILPIPVLLVILFIILFMLLSNFAQTYRTW